MTRKYRSGEIRLPFLKYRWAKEINKEIPDIKVLQNQIDNFIFVVNNKNDFKIDDFKDEFKVFTTSIIAHGHVTKLEEPYQKKFLEINKFVKEMWDGSPVYIYKMKGF